MSIKLPLSPPRRRHRFRVTLLTGALVTLYYFFGPGWLSSPSGPEASLSRADTAANSTLGFGHVYAISKRDSPRRESLIHAANVTELDLTIPLQPQWTPEDERKFRLPENSTIGTGSLLAWLGHLHSLRQFLASGAETALFLEDDVDWDVRLRAIQTPLVSSAMRRILSVTRYTKTAKASPGLYPWGHPADWDLLYIGHCGDYFRDSTPAGFADGFVTPANLSDTAHMAFADPTVLPREDLHPWTASLLENLGVGPGTRLLHRSRFPLCTFAYAVTRAAAERLVHDIAGAEPRRAGHKAFDVTVLHACNNYGLRCWSVNPELFHHAPGTSIIDVLEEGGRGTPPVDKTAQEVIFRRGETANIGCGFWSGVYAFEEGEEDRLEYMRREFGRRGRCWEHGGAGDGTADGPRSDGG